MAVNWPLSYFSLSLPSVKLYPASSFFLLIVYLLFSGYQLVTKVPLSAAGDVYLIDHAWTAQYKTAREVRSSHLLFACFFAIKK